MFEGVTYEKQVVCHVEIRWSELVKNHGMMERAREEPWDGVIIKYVRMSMFCTICFIEIEFVRFEFSATCFINLSMISQCVSACSVSIGHF